ncbi:uncharacterized protein LOC128239975 [Mya arenaria]|uniref:uncharacterized protein LOC128239975 n=1 Tax=Mya arenaria TaxID=6604 RepID=UPI0022E21872|nr:uncharacterized protein LOC128239975 [Mya arenaria]
MMEARLLLCCLVLGGLVGTMEQALLQINERQDKTPERTSDQKGLSSTKEDETSVGLSKDMLPLKTYTKLIGTKNPKSTLDKAEKRVIRSNYLAFNNSTGNKKCEMEMSRFSLDYFMYSIQRYESNYVFLGLRQANSSSGITIRSKPDVINGDIWIWTFWGKDGAQEFLRWPIEFGIWSMGILYQSVLRHPKVLSVTLKRVSGDCSNLTVGNKDDDLAISNALNGITLALMSNLSDGEKYGPSYYCYTRKRNITEYMKVICENIVCPFEGIEQVCCDYRFNKTKMERNVICPEYEFMYDTISWMVPIMLAIVLFVYFPILLFFVAYKIFDDPRSTYVPPSLTVQSFKGSDDGCQEEELDGCHTSKMYLLEG